MDMAWIRQKFPCLKPNWQKDKWACLVDMGEGSAHIIPTEDVVECHEVDETCPCGPRVEILTDHPAGMPDVHMYVHHALDGRP